MNIKIMNEEELNDTKCGEAITVAAVMAILATAIVAVVIYKLYTSSKGSTTIPGGWKFTWN